MKDILIVEDGRQERERLEKLFGAAGYSVSGTETVGEAEVLLQKDHYRLAILDIGLSDKSGSYLFTTIKRGGKVTDIIIFTGNPSVHLKQRFISEGAADYIVKGTQQAGNENFIARVKEILGEPQGATSDGMELDSFLQKYVSQTSRQLFLDMDNSYPRCSGCGSQSYNVTFSHQPQMPPEISGLVVCAACGKPMDPEIK
jgi:DNA-binding response OmpR family regulator